MRLLKYFTLVFLLSEVIINPLSAAQITEIDDDCPEYTFSFQNVSILEDDNYNIDQLSKGLLDKKFKVNKLYAPHNSNISKAYWVRIKIKGNPDSNKKWILEFFDQTTDYIEAYIPDGKGGYTKKIMGDSFPFMERRFVHKNFEIDIPNNTSEVQDYFFKVKSHNQINIIIVLRSMDYFIYYALNEYFLYGLFYGMILIIIIYNFLMFLAIKEFQYVSYVMYALSVGFYFMCLDGIAYQYLWPDHPEWNQKAYGIFLFSLIFWALIFTKNFLHLKSRYPLLDTIVNYTLIVRTAIFLIALLFYPKLFEHRWIEIYPLFLACICGIISYIKGYKPARFFVLAYSFLFFGFIARILINLDISFIPASVVVHYSINLSFGCEMWLLSFALADKVRIIKNTKDRAQKRIIKQHEINQKLKDKVNKELEKEVSKRTREINDQKQIIETQNQELQKVNEVLRQQADEIKKMNSILDKDNYKLKNTIKEEMLARAANKNMNYSEFKVIFPNELSCFRYLEQEKWKHGFICKKCENAKFISGKGKFDRRCTRCGYNESPTAFTIFHGIKFSIEKAFYILHLVITERDDLTIDEISQTLELRRNTCWNFKNKISKIIKKHGKDKEYYEHWEKVIFEVEEDIKKVV
ncbi:MAG TPA: 7TM diverse intracellular signaling domain-containing protein [Cytophagales bacterium]|nr:7TM diverse intracellular signaling domain-containing protein [Cytophagales bacterium]